MQTKIYLCYQRMADTILANKEELTELDRKIGDGDHGLNLSRGFEEVRKVLNEEETDIGAALKKAAMALISRVGGASGPLYGTAFLRASGVCVGKSTLTTSEFGAALSAAVEGVKARGKAEAGEKTMLDALLPARNAFLQAEQEGKTLAACLDAMCEAAEQGAEYTKTIPATKGRASYLGERSIGHMDPGAASSLLLLKAIRDSILFS